MLNLPKVLLVEDDTELRAVVRDILEDEGFDVTAIGTYAEALAILDGGFTPNAALLDHKLPDGFGSDLCRLIKDRYPGVLCVLFSGLREAAPLAIGAGADHWLFKPFGMDELVRRVRVLAPLSP